MTSKTCTKCGWTKPAYNFSIRRQERILEDGTKRTYYHTQAYCYECRHPHYKSVQLRLEHPDKKWIPPQATS